MTDAPGDSWDDHDSYCSSIAPAMFKLFPADEEKRKQRMKEAAERFSALTRRMQSDAILGPHRTGGEIRRWDAVRLEPQPRGQDRLAHESHRDVEAWLAVHISGTLALLSRDRDAV